MRFVRFCLLTLSAILYVPAAAGSLIFWDFENSVPAPGGSSSVGLALTPGVTGIATQTGGGPAENFGGSFGLVHLTRFFGSAHPVLDITFEQAGQLDAVTFQHIHNNNPGFSTFPSYRTQIQVNTGSGFFDVGPSVLLSSATNTQFDTVNLGGITVGAGTVQLRWVPRGLNPGAGFPVNTNTEYFALNDVTVSGTAEVPTPPAYWLVAVGLLGVVRVWRQGTVRKASLLRRLFGCGSGLSGSR